MRLDRYLHEAGLGTRKEVNMMIRARRVRVNDVEVRDGAFHVPAGARVDLDGLKVEPIGMLIFMFHKPSGVVTSTRDKEPTIYSLLPGLPGDLLPVGRLDKDTEGLLLLTNDGQLLHRLTSPRWHVEKEYHAELKTPMAAGGIAPLFQPLDLGNGEWSRPAIAAELASPDLLKITIDEGKYHQVKRMVRAIGNEVVRLKRVRIGPLRLGDLEPGRIRPLTPAEEDAIRAVTGGASTA
jgi:16S rRNA pseudouridine516 synthase